MDDGDDVHSPNSSDSPDGEYVHGLVDAMADFLYHSLKLTDHELVDYLSLNTSDMEGLSTKERIRRREIVRKTNDVREITAINGAQLLQREINVKCTDERLAILTYLARQRDMAINSMQLVLLLLNGCAHLVDDCWIDALTPLRWSAGPNIYLGNYYMTSPYFGQASIYKRQNKLHHFGGIGFALCRTVTEATRKWLCYMDRLHCKAFKLESSFNQEVSDLIAELATAFGRRHTLCLSNELELDDDAIHPCVLAERVLAMRARAKPNAKRQMEHDRTMLNAMRAIATDGADSPAAHAALTTQAVELLAFAETPINELLMQYKRTDLAATTLLCVLLAKTTPLETRQTMACMWRDEFGQKMVVYIDKSFALMEEAMHRGDRAFWPVITEKQKDSWPLDDGPAPVIRSPRNPYLPHDPSAPAPPRAPPLSASAVPPSPMVESGRHWWLTRPVHVRDGFEGHERRLLFLLSFVYQFTTRSTIGVQLGIVRKTTVVSTLQQAFLDNHFARFLVETEKLRYNQGVRLRSYELSANDPSSNIGTGLNTTLCHLSRFSMLQIDTVFGDVDLADGCVGDTEETKIGRRVTRETAFATVAERVLAAFGARTVSPYYTNIARDALDMLLPIVRSRRAFYSLDRLSRPAAIVDLLHTSPKIRAWRAAMTAPETERVNEGASVGRPTLELDLDDVKKAHPDLRRVLEVVTSRPSRLVRRERGSKRATRFVFDQVALSGLLLTGVRRIPYVGPTISKPSTALKRNKSVSSRAVHVVPPPP